MLIRCIFIQALTYTLKSCITSEVHQGVRMPRYSMRIHQEWLQTVLNTVYQR
nr:MAG TPA: hypothetical protein [Bacteriophage sp.]